MKEELVRNGYDGKWVAIYAGEVVDSGYDKRKLFMKIGRRYKGESVYMNRCSSEPKHPGPRILGSLELGLIP